MKTEIMMELGKHWIIQDVKSGKYVAAMQPKSWSSEDVDFVVLEENAVLFDTKEDAKKQIQQFGYDWGRPVSLEAYPAINEVINLACEELDYNDYEDFLSFSLDDFQAESYKLELQNLRDEEVQDVISEITNVLKK